MMIWIGLILLICAGFSAYAGASQLEQAKQRAKCSLDAFTERRNGGKLHLSVGSVRDPWGRHQPVTVHFSQAFLLLPKPV